MTEIAAHPVHYVALPIIGALAALIAARLGTALCWHPQRRAVATSHAHGLAAAIAGLAARSLSAQELLARLDPAEIAERIQGPLRKLVDETTVELMQRHKPDMWELLPLRMKRTVIERARSRAPSLAGAVLGALEVDAGDVLDLEALIARVLAEEPALLRRIVRELHAPLLRSVTVAAAALGFLFGIALLLVVAAVAALGGFALGVAVAGPVLVVPVACLLATLPVRRYLGRHRKRFTEVLACRIADPVLGFTNIITELVSGARRDRVEQLVRREVTAAVDDQAGVAKPLVSAAIGASQFQHIKRGAAQRAMDGATALSKHVDEYADESMQVRAALSYRLRRAGVHELAVLPRRFLRAARGRMLLCAVLLGILGAAGQFAVATLTVGVG